MNTLDKTMLPVYIWLQYLPFASSEKRDVIEVTAGKTISEILEEIGICSADFNGNIQVQGIPVNPIKFNEVRPLPGDIVNMIIIPSGGDTKRLLAQIAILGVSAWIGGPAVLGYAAGSWQAGLATGAISALLSKALIKPSRQPSYVSQGNNDPRTVSFSGTQNVMNPYGAVPKTFGKRLVYPPLAAVPYTELVGNDEYLRMMFNIGYGRNSVGTIKIGETSIDDYSDVEYEVLEGYPGELTTDFDKLYPYDANSPTDVATIVTKTGGAVQRATNADIDEIIVNIGFPQGLYQIGIDDGLRYQCTVQIKIEYSLTGEDSWTEATTLTVTDDSMQVVRQGYRFAVTNGQYDVRLTRLTDDTSSDYTFDKFYWTTMQDFKHVDPVNMEELTRIALRIKMTDQLSGVIEKLNCVFQAYKFIYQFSATDISAAAADQSFNSVSTDFTSYFSEGDFIQVSGFTTAGNNANPKAKYDGNSVFSLLITSLAAHKIIVSDPRTGSTFAITNEIAGDTIVMWKEAITRNPAWAYTDLLRGRGTKTPLDDSRLKLDSINTWAGHCTTAARYFDEYIETAESKEQLRNDILAAGRGSFGIEDSKYSVIEDVEQTTPAQVLTPLNSWGLTSSSDFVTKIHGWKVRFRNEDKNYDWDDRIVYVTGYDADTATRLEDLVLRGVTDPDQVWKDGMYNHAVAIHRPSVITAYMDWEFLAIDKLGSLILVNHDVIMKGIHRGRITVVTTDEVTGDCTHITVDQNFVMEEGNDYAVQVRKSDVTIVSQQIVTDAGAQTEVEFSTPIPAANPHPVVGDICMFGLLGYVSGNYILKAIEPGPEDWAQLTLHDEGPAIYSADTGDIPAWTSSITREPKVKQNYPPDPVIYNVRSDESVLIRQGYKNPPITQVLISLQKQKRDGVQAKYYQARYKRTTEAQYIKTDFISAENDEISLRGVQDGIAYDIEIRSIADNFQTSGWLYEYTDYKGDAASLHNYTIVGKSNSPTDISTFAVSVEGEKIRASWDKITDIDNKTYDLRYGAAGISWADASATNIDAGDTDEWIFPALAAGSYKFMIKARDWAENSSDTEASANLTITGPSTPADAGSYAEYNKIKFSIQDCTQSFAIQHYLFYRGSGDDLELIGKNKTTTFTYIEYNEGEQVYSIKAIDIAGNVSAAGEITLNITNPPDFKLLDTLTSIFSGTCVNTVQEVLVNGYRLKALMNTTKTTQDFINDFGDIVRIKPLHEMYPVDTGSYEEEWDYGANITSGGILQLEIDKQAVVGSIEDMDITPIISVSANGSDWTDYEGYWAVNHTATFRYVKLHLDFQASAVNKIINISAIRIRLKKERVYDRGQIAIDDPTWVGNDITVSFNETFIDVENLTITAIDAGGSPTFDTTGWRIANPTDFTVSPYIGGVAGKTAFSWSAEGT